MPKVLPIWESLPVLLFAFTQGYHQSLRLLIGAAPLTDSLLSNSTLRNILVKTVSYPLCRRTMNAFGPVRITAHSCRKAAYKKEVGKAPGLLVLFS